MKLKSQTEQAGISKKERLLVDSAFAKSLKNRRIILAVFYFLHTPQVPPSLAQCLQYLQFLQARQFALPVQVAEG